MILIRFHSRVVIVESDLIVRTGIGIDDAHVEELTVLQEFIVPPIGRLTHSILWKILLNDLEKLLGKLCRIALQTVTLVGTQLHLWCFSCTGTRLDGS